MANGGIEMTDGIISSNDTPLIIIGSGGHARVLLDLVNRIGRQVLFMTDINKARHEKILEGIRIRGDDSLILQYAPANVELVNGIGSIEQPVARRQVYEKFKNDGYTFATLIHPSATVSPRATLDEGAQVMSGAVVQTGAHIGENALINTHASVDHDCFVGRHTHIAPGVTLSGNVNVGESSHLGTGSLAIQGIRIGSGALVAAGSVVVRPVPDGAIVMGVPAVQRKPRARVAETDHATLRVLNVMVSAVGRRVVLIRLLGQSLCELGIQGKIVATDIAPDSSAFHQSKPTFLVPNYSDPDCLRRMLSLCREQEIGLIVPTIDPDLPFFAAHRESFDEIGTRIMVSSAEAVAISNDKQATHRWLVENRFPTVQQAPAAPVLAGEATFSFPCFAKPRYGSSSIGARVVKNLDDLRLLSRGKEYVVQEIASGVEYTVDVYVDEKGACRCVVPRLRLQTRGGEVSKGMTVRCAPMQDLVRRVAEALPGAWGVLNIQVFYDVERGLLNVSEVNARFGGGYPLTHQAGAPMVRWLIEETLGLPLTAEEDQWTDGLVMLRYDDAVFVTRTEAGLDDPLSHPPSIGTPIP